VVLAVRQNSEFECALPAEKVTQSVQFNLGELTVNIDFDAFAVGSPSLAAPDEPANQQPPAEPVV